MEKRNKKINRNSTVEAAVNSFRTEGRGKILSDILGSYTGNAADGDRPEQDADDL